MKPEFNAKASGLKDLADRVRDKITDVLEGLGQDLGILPRPVPVPVPVRGRPAPPRR